MRIFFFNNWRDGNQTEFVFLEISYLKTKLGDNFIFSFMGFGIIFNF